MKKLRDSFDKVQTALTVFFLIVMACSSMLQVLNRNIFKLPLSWTEEVSRYSMIWMTMIGTGISVRRGMQMSLDIWGKRLHGTARVVMDIFSYLATMAFCGTVMVCITKLIKTQKASGQVSPALHIPMYIMTFSVFIGMLFLCLVEIEQIVEVIRSKGQDPAEKEYKEAEEE